MKDIYEMFKSGMSTDQIYDEFIKEYDAAKIKHNEDVKRAKEEEARKAREEKEKAAAAAKKIVETSRKNRALPRYRDALVDAFYDYFDFLLPEPLDYEEVFPKIEKGIMDFEDTFLQTLDAAQPLIDLLIKAIDGNAADDKSDDENEWEVDLESSLNIDGKEVSNNKTRLSSQDNLKTEAVEKHLNSFLTSLDEDKRRIHEYLDKIMKEKP